MIKQFIHIGIIAAIILGFAACSTTRKTADSSDNIPEEVSRLKQLESTALLIDASRQKMQANWANATVLYSEALIRDPRNTAAMYELARIHAEKGYFDDAQKYITPAIRLEPDNIYFRHTLADIYFLQNNKEKGLDIHRQTAEQNRDNLNLQLRLFGNLMQLKRYDEALAQIVYIDTLMGFTAEMSLQRQNLYVLMGEADKAIEEAEILAEHFPNEISFQEVLAELYFENNREEDAYRLFLQMLDMEPDNPMVRLQMADYYRKNKEEEKALGQIIKAFQSHGLSIDGKHRIVMSYFIMGEEEDKYKKKGYDLVEVLVETHPDDAYSQALYADFLFRDEKYEQAKKHYLKAVELDPAELIFWQQILFIDSQLEDFYSMKEVSGRSLDYFFEHAVLYLFNGIANLQLGYYDEAVNAFEQGKALSLNNKELQTRFYTLLGDSYYKAGNSEASFSAYESALKLNPNNTFALNNYSYYLALKKKNLEFALEMAAEANRLEPGNAAYQDTYGWVKYQLGDFEEAKRWIEKALQTAEEPGAAVMEHYGDVLYKLGDKQKALQYWEKAKEHGGETSDFLPRKIQDKTLYE